MNALPHGHQGHIAKNPQSSTGDPAPSGDKIAHELANLLDGSLRNVGLVLSALRKGDGVAGTDQDGADDVLQRLQVTNEAMRQMAWLVRGWMDAIHQHQPLERDNRTLSDAVGHAVQLLSAAAEMRQVHVRIDLEPRAAQLPAGAVYSVVANALRNSLEAIDSLPMDSPHRGGTIEVRARVTDQELTLNVADDGPGLAPELLDDAGAFQTGRTTKPSGHGLGLELCREVALSLGGSLTLKNRSPRGAILTLRCPLPSVQS
ncbi:MAG: HAMP domain-containing histidine kinase [Phycisphaeraceae bacterium]|nr:HAMP domain-containing histidine kinase [Phycisphaeraceae bacterium]